MPQPVQIVLSDEQIGLLGVAADITLRNDADEEHGLVSLTDEERDEYRRLAVFLTTVSANPGAFPVTGRMAKSLKAKARAVKGEAQPPSRKNKRKARQEKRIGFSKERRRQRKETVANFNAAQAQYEKDVAEMEEAQAELRARLEAEPKFDIVDAGGTVMVSGVPQSMIVAQLETEPPVEEVTGVKSQVIIPGSAEHLGVEVS